MFDAFVQSHRGYRITLVLQEFWDELDPEFVAYGWGTRAHRLRRVVHRTPRTRATSWLRTVPRGVTREDCLAIPGSLAAPLFLYAPPRLSFHARRAAHAVGGANGKNGSGSRPLFGCCAPDDQEPLAWNLRHCGTPRAGCVAALGFT